MRYLFVAEDGAVVQKELLEVSAEDAASINDGILDVYRFEPDRGFCRALVGEDEDDECAVAVQDWEMVDLRR